jgi:hypothetical protein
MAQYKKSAGVPLWQVSFVHPGRRGAWPKQQPNNHDKLNNKI